MTYRIRNWSDIYENNRTRELRKMDWLPLPVKLDGDGYTYLMALPDGPAVFGCFVACSEVAARCEPRGTLVRRGGRSHDCDSLARMTRMPVDLVQRMLDICTHETEWIEIVEDAAACGNPAGTPQEGAGSPHSITGQDTEGKDSAAPPRTAPSVSTAAMLTEEYRIEYYRQFPTAHPDKLMLVKWQRAAEQLLVDAGKTATEIRDCWRAVHADSYWRGKVYGLDKLREHWIRGKFDELLANGRKAAQETTERDRKQQETDSRIEATRKAFRAGEWVLSTHYDELPAVERDVVTEIDAGRYTATGAMFIRMKTRTEQEIMT